MVVIAYLLIVFFILGMIGAALLVVGLRLWEIKKEEAAIYILSGMILILLCFPLVYCFAVAG